MYRRVPSGSVPPSPPPTPSLLPPQASSSSEHPPIVPSMFDRNFINVLILGLSFMFLFTSFQTGGIIQETVVSSIPKDPNFSDYKGDGLISVSIIYAVLAIANWLAPAFVGLLGPRISMILAGLTYCLFTANFLYPMTWGLYFVSVVVGIGAALIWTAQGNYLTLCSTDETMSRNSSLFWALLQCSFLWGNIFVYFAFKTDDDTKDGISSSKRVLTYSVLTAVGLVGVACFFFLGTPDAKKDDDNEKKEDSFSLEYILQSLKNSVNLLRDTKMILLLFTFVYTGFELGFFSIVYSTTVGHTTNLDPEGKSAKKFVGLVGMLIGVGEIVGGLSFGILGEKFAKIGRNSIVILGFMVHILAFVLIIVNFATDANFKDTTENGIIKSSLAIALLVAFMLGFADACFNTQVYSIIGVIYSDNSASAFALFKFFQSIACAVALVYSRELNLLWQLIVLVVFGTMSTVTFFICDRMSTNRR